MKTVKREQVLVFRAARHGLAAREADNLVEAAACPASDFARDGALMALAARTDSLTRESFDRATDAGELVLGFNLRGAIHAIPPPDLALYGPALVSDEDDELAEQLGPGAKGHLAEVKVPAGEALDEVTEATRAALKERGPLAKDDLHEELRSRVRDELLPWCKGCRSNHVAPMIWRYALVRLGTRCDSQRRHRLAKPGRRRRPEEAVRRFLSFYGPATVKDFTAWAGLARAHARRLWEPVERELVKVDGAWLLAEDEAELASPPQARGTRLLPERDPYLQHPDRAALAPDAELRKRLFRPVAGPGAVLEDGRLVGLWRARAKGKRLEFEVEPLTRVKKKPLQAETERLAELRGKEAALVTGL